MQTIHHKYPNTSTLSKFDYTYNKAGNIMTWRQQADGDAVLWKYGYDAANQLTQAVEWDTEATPSILKRYAYGYDPAGNRTHEQIDDAITAASHDSLNRLTAHAAGGALTFSGTISEPGTVTIQGHSAQVNSSNAFRGSVPTTGGINTVTIVATDANSNQAAQAYEVDVVGGTRTFTYDANGNLTSDGTRTFEWNALNQLVAVNVGLDRTEFSYSGLGLKATKSTSEGTTSFIYSGYQLVEERPEGSAAIRYWYGLGLDDLRARLSVGGSATFFTTDHLGSISAQTDVSGALVGSMNYDPYGNPDSSTTGVASFSGRTWEDEVAAYYYRTRYYDASMGRFISDDPSKFDGGVNFYSYVVNNPLRFTDPFGLAYFAKRPLKALPWLGSPSCNGLDDFLNTEISHEQLFFEDGKNPPNIGFFDDNTLRTETNPTGYQCRSGSFDDCIMRKAVANTPPLPKYCLIGANCQTWTARVRQEYTRLSKDSQVKKECGCKE